MHALVERCDAPQEDVVEPAPPVGARLAAVGGRRSAPRVGVLGQLPHSGEFGGVRYGIEVTDDDRAVVLGDGCREYAGLVRTDRLLAPFGEVGVEDPDGPAAHL